jgi:hypothetical protein
VTAPVEIVRDSASPLRPTTGEMLIEGEHFCWTLEDPWKNNEPNVSCIPTGTYSIISTLSVRFSREMPRLIGVPGRTGILVHPGNTDRDTEGCILVGEKRLGVDLLNSRHAFNRFVVWLSSVGNEARVTVRNRATPNPEML